MKTASIPSPLNLNVALVAVLFAAVVLVAVTGRRVPILSDSRMAVIALLILGMAMCAMGGIGRVAAVGDWTHPLSMLGYLLGAAILVVGLGALFGLKLAFIQTDLQAVWAIVILTGVKVGVSVVHSALIGV